jgi:hypothetical protein
MTEDEALTIVAREFPPVFLDVWNRRVTPFRTTFWARPHTYFLGPEALAEIAPGLHGLCPLLEQNGEAIIGRLPDGRFVRYYYEDGSRGDAAIEVLGARYQEFVLTLLLELADSGLVEELAEFGTPMQFTYTAELIAALQQSTEDDIEALRRRVAAEA